MTKQVESRHAADALRASAACVTETYLRRAATGILRRGRGLGEPTLLRASASWRAAEAICAMVRPSFLGLVKTAPQ